MKCLMNDLMIVILQQEHFTESKYSIKEKKVKKDMVDKSGTS